MNHWYNIKNEAILTKENKFAELSVEFSVDIINLVKSLKTNHESIISNQIGISGASIGANIHEAQYAQGKKDFILKLEIALKEAKLFFYNDIPYGYASRHIHKGYTLCV